MTSRHLLLGALAATAALAPAAASAKKPTLPLIRTYDVRISATMDAKFNFQPDPTGCNGQLPEGYSGGGQEHLEMTSPKPIRVQMILQKGIAASVMRKDLKSYFPIAGTTKRSGTMSQVVCNDHPPANIEPCLGEHRIHDNMELTFFPGKFLVGTQDVLYTSALIPGCNDDAFDWQGATARTGAVMMDTAGGKAAYSKMKANSFTLVAHHHNDCDATEFGTGTCGADWTYTVNFKRVKKTKHRRHR